VQTEELPCKITIQFEQDSHQGLFQRALTFSAFRLLI